MEGNRAPFPVVQSPAEEVGGRLSPDGRWIAYYSDEPRPWSVFVQRFSPGAGPAQRESGRQQRVQVAEGVDPRWSPQGGELFFISGQDMMAATIDAVDWFRVRSIRKLFPVGRYFHRGFGYAISPDGQRFLFSAPAAPPAATIVVNLAAKLAR
jgi:hypothetical protein